MLDKINTENTEIDNSLSETYEPEYPSAELFVEACYQDYHRLQENYNKLYDKVYYALCLIGVVLTVITSTLDFATLNLPLKEMTIGKVICTEIAILSMFSGFFLIGLSTILLLILLRGKKVTVFDSLKIRSGELYLEKKDFASVWLIGAYTDAVNEIKPVIEMKQKKYNRALTILIIGIILYVIAMLLHKGGF